MKENALQSKCVNWLKSKNIYYIKTVVSSRAGVPDLIICLNGKFLAVELKGENGRISELQRYNLQQIVLSGGAAVVVNSFEAFIQIINKVITNN